MTTISLEDVFKTNLPDGIYLTHAESLNEVEPSVYIPVSKYSDRLSDEELRGEARPDYWRIVAELDLEYGTSYYRQYDEDELWVVTNGVLS